MDYVYVLRVTACSSHILLGYSCKCYLKGQGHRGKTDTVINGVGRGVCDSLALCLVRTVSFAS